MFLFGFEREFNNPNIIGVMKSNTGHMIRRPTTESRTGRQPKLRKTEIQMA
jgi:hypothetical protein